MVSFLLRSSFLRTINRWQAPTQRPSIGQRPVEQTAYLTEIKDNGYKSIFTNSWLLHVRQRNRSWIKGVGKNPFIAQSDGIPERDQRNGYKSVFTNSWLLRQRNRSWIKGVGKNPFIACSAFCPGPPNHDPMDSEKQLHVFKSSATMAHHAWRVDKAPAKTHKNRNARLDALQSAVPKKLRVYTASDAKWLLLGDCT